MPTREIRIGLLADPDLPASLADQLHPRLPEKLCEAISDTVSWSVDVVHDAFEVRYSDHGLLMAKAREHVQKTVWDVVICVTDEAMWNDLGVVIASVDTDERVAVVSLPALGGLRLSHRLETIMVPIIAHVVAQHDGVKDVAGDTELRDRLPWRSARVLGPEPSSAHLDIVYPGRAGTSNLLAGMVRANRPLGLVRGLTTALAGTLAGIAFGVLFSTIWTLGNAIGPLRLAGLIVAAVAAMTIWLIAGHGLWERNRSDGRATRLRNASTVATVTIGAVAFFLAAFVIALAAVIVIIPPNYLATTLGHPTGPSDYLSIALVAAALGLLAGAVGSGLEDDTTVGEATYGRREQTRRQMAEREADNNDTTPTSPFRQA